MKRLSLLVLILMLSMLMVACSQNDNDKDEITPIAFTDIIGETVDDISVKEQLYNVYGNEMELGVSSISDKTVVGYIFHTNTLGPSKEDCLRIQDIYNSMCNQFGKPKSGTNFSKLDEQEIYGLVPTYSAYWDYNEDIEIELRYQLTQKALGKDIAAAGHLNISIIVGWPIEKWS